MSGDDQEKLVEASSRAVTKVRLAPMRRKVPRKSTRCIECLENMRGIVVADLPWCGKLEGSRRPNKAIAMAPAGTLLLQLSKSDNFLTEIKGGRGAFAPVVLSARTYLSRKTHLQVVLSIMTPPINGPSTVASAMSADIMLPYFAYFSLGISSKNTIMDIEKQPAAPMPWMVRRTILQKHLSLQCS